MGILVLPTHREGFPIVLREAAAIREAVYQEYMRWLEGVGYADLR